MRRISVLVFGCALLSLAACTAPRWSMRSSSSSTAASSVSSAAKETDTLEYGDAEAAVSSTGSVAVHRAMPERLLPTGILEIGDASAPLVLLTFTHHSCAYCKTLHDAILPHLIEDFIAKGKVRLQIALLSIRKYPEGDMQSKFLTCAAAEGKGLLMHNALFMHSMGETKITQILERELKLNVPNMEACLNAPGTIAALQNEQSLARSLGVTLVPSFFLNGEKFVGLPEYPDLRGRIEEALSKM